MRRLGVLGVTGTASTSTAKISVARISVAASAGFLVAALLGACGSAAAPGPDTASPEVPTVPPLTSAPASGGASSGASVAPPAESLSPSATPAPRAVNWQTLKTPDGQLQFDYPADWTIKDRSAEASPAGVFLEVLNPHGKSLATLRTNVAAGSDCTEKIPYSVLDLDPVPALAQQGVTPHFIFELRLYPSETDPTKANVMAYGINSAPKPSGRDACPISQSFTWPPSAASFGGVYNPFDTTPGNEPNIDTPEAYRDTAEYKDIKRMITSLRPAGQ
jgi:hypothetical protein